MKIGFVGLGKLGFPTALTVAYCGHEVIGYDVNSNLMNSDPKPYLEAGPKESHGSPMDHYLDQCYIRFGSLQEVADFSDIIFVAVQTPHKPDYEGITRLPSTREDFDYTFLIEALSNLSSCRFTRETVVAIISTVLPGTFRRYLLPIIHNDNIKLVYSPQFIAMGTVMKDFLNPEFWLIGTHDEWAGYVLEDFFLSIAKAPVSKISVESAELVKVAYNTWVSSKITFANTLGEISHKIPGCNVDDVTKTLAMANRRLLSPLYMSAGMGDGGSCHPRDNIALSWLSRELNLSYDIFESLMLAREKHAEWLADLMCSYDLTKFILGYAFKAESNLIDGSAALLVKEILLKRGQHVLNYDPFYDHGEWLQDKLPYVFLIGARHQVFCKYLFPEGSVVIDPWRYIPQSQDNVTYIRIGE